MDPTFLQKGMPQSSRYYDISPNEIKLMSTIQVTKQWQPQPSKSLVESNPVKEGKKLSLEENHSANRSHYCAADMMGLSWILSDDILGDI